MFTFNKLNVCYTISVRRSRTLDFKNNNGNCTPVRSQSIIAVTSKTQERSSGNLFDDSLNNVSCEDISKQTDLKINSLLPSSQLKHDNATQIQLKYINRPSSNSPPFSYNIIQPDVTNLVSPRASVCSTPGMTGSELDLEEEDPSSDESWGMLSYNYIWV